MYANVVFVIRCLYSAVSLTLVKEQRFIRIIIYYYYYYYCLEFVCFVGFPAKVSTETEGISYVYIQYSDIYSLSGIVSLLAASKCENKSHGEINGYMMYTEESSSHAN